VPKETHLAQEYDAAEQAEDQYGPERLAQAIAEDESMPHAGAARLQKAVPASRYP
jgi:hypothetical protein